MKINTPINDRRIMFADSDVLISKTNLKGAITYVNRPFVIVSGFEEAELLGKNHNVVRHPDMPTHVFEELWTCMKRGSPWQGIIKNRAKNGDYYWVNAHVAPIKEYGQVIEYMSVRYAPSVDEVNNAERTFH